MFALTYMKKSWSVSEITRENGEADRQKHQRHISCANRPESSCLIHVDTQICWQQTTQHLTMLSRRHNSLSKKYEHFTVVHQILKSTYDF